MRFVCVGICRWLLVLLLLLFAAGQMEAQESSGKSSAKPDLKIVDANSDGEVTKDELKQFLTETYLEAWADKIDANQNGKISKWEFRLAKKALEQVFLEQGRADTAIKSMKRRPMSSIEMMNQRFESQKPLTGTVVESLTAFNEDGEEIDIKDFRGKHVVLVFGCLT